MRYRQSEMAILLPSYTNHCPADLPIRLTIISPDSANTVGVIFFEMYLLLGCQSALHFAVCKIGCPLVVKELLEILPLLIFNKPMLFLVLSKIQLPSVRSLLLTYLLYNMQSSKEFPNLALRLFCVSLCIINAQLLILDGPNVVISSLIILST